jgi:hypothetical protein
VRLSAVAVSCLALCACGTSPETKRVEAKRVEASRVSLLVPRGWTVVDARTALRSERIRAVEAENPEFGKRIRELEHPRNPIKLLAVPPDAGGSINVFVFRAGRGETVTDFATRVLESLRRVPGFRELDRRRVLVAGGRAEELRYVVPYRLRGKALRLQTLQVLLIRNGREYAVTYAGTPETFSELEPLFRESIATLRVG